MKINTILLDLDDTLLTSNMGQFIPAYINGLSKALIPFISPDKVPPLLMACTQKMQSDTNPNQLNAQVFSNCFLPHLNGSRTEIEAALNNYYQTDYPELNRLTTTKPQASQLVKHLLEKNYKVVIATNPLFPTTAIHQRMAWAGVLNFDYPLVTTMDNMHFCKPNPLYYQEILERIDSKPQETLMVGDHPENDIIPAHSLNIKTWWITASTRLNISVDSIGQGSLGDFWDFIKAGKLE